MLSSNKSKIITATNLRKKGATYPEISKLLGVSKSTLSYWLRDVDLPESAKGIIERKKRSAAQLGADARHNQKIQKIKEIEATAALDIYELTHENIWLVGIILYWAEGNKEKINGRSERVSFSNSDSRMLLMFKYWLVEVIKVQEADLIFELYVHKDNPTINEALTYWSKELNINSELFNVYYKKNQATTRTYKNEYYGLVRIKVRRSTDLNRKISGWIKAIYESFCSRVV